MKKTPESQPSSPAPKANRKSKVPEGIKSDLESRFQEDFSELSIHIDSPLASMRKTSALTRGNEIHFAPGQYQPYSAEGRKLIAHEAAHVVQQSKGRAAGMHATSGKLPNEHRLEAEADQAAEDFFLGRAIQIRELAPFGAEQRKDFLERPTGNLEDGMTFHIDADGDYFDKEVLVNLRWVNTLGRENKDDSADEQLQMTLSYKNNSQTYLLPIPKKRIDLNGSPGGAQYLIGQRMPENDEPFQIILRDNYWTSPSQYLTTYYSNQYVIGITKSMVDGYIEYLPTLRSISSSGEQYADSPRHDYPAFSMDLPIENDQPLRGKEANEITPVFQHPDVQHAIDEFGFEMGMSNEVLPQNTTINTYLGKEVESKSYRDYIIPIRTNTGYDQFFFILREDQNDSNTLQYLIAYQNLLYPGQLVYDNPQFFSFGWTLPPIQDLQISNKGTGFILRWGPWINLELTYSIQGPPEELSNSRTASLFIRSIPQLLPSGLYETATGTTSHSYEVYGQSVRLTNYQHPDKLSGQSDFEAPHLLDLTAGMTQTSYARELEQMEEIEFSLLTSAIPLTGAVPISLSRKFFAFRGAISNLDADITRVGRGSGRAWLDNESSIATFLDEFLALESSLTPEQQKELDAKREDISKEFPLTQEQISGRSDVFSHYGNIPSTGRQTVRQESESSRSGLKEKWNSNLKSAHTNKSHDTLMATYRNIYQNYLTLVLSLLESERIQFSLAIMNTGNEAEKQSLQQQLEALNLIIINLDQKLNLRKAMEQVLIDNDATADEMIPIPAIFYPEIEESTLNFTKFPLPLYYVDQGDKWLLIAAQNIAQTRNHVQIRKTKNPGELFPSMEAFQDLDEKGGLGKGYLWYRNLDTGEDHKLQFTEPPSVGDYFTYAGYGLLAAWAVISTVASFGTLGPAWAAGLTSAAAMMGTGSIIAFGGAGLYNAVDQFDDNTHSGSQMFGDLMAIFPALSRVAKIGLAFNAGMGVNKFSRIATAFELGADVGGVGHYFYNRDFSGENAFSPDKVLFDVLTIFQGVGAGLGTKAFAKGGFSGVLEPDQTGFKTFINYWTEKSKKIEEALSQAPQNNFKTKVPKTGVEVPLLFKGKSEGMAAVNKKYLNAFEWFSEAEQTRLSTTIDGFSPKQMEDLQVLIKDNPAESVFLSLLHQIDAGKGVNFKAIRNKFKKGNAHKAQEEKKRYKGKYAETQEKLKVKQEQLLEAEKQAEIAQAKKKNQQKVDESNKELEEEIEKLKTEWAKEKQEVLKKQKQELEKAERKFEADKKKLENDSEKLGKSYEANSKKKLEQLILEHQNDRKNIISKANRKLAQITEKYNEKVKQLNADGKNAQTSIRSWEQSELERINTEYPELIQSMQEGMEKLSQQRFRIENDLPFIQAQAKTELSRVNSTIAKNKQAMGELEIEIGKLEATHAKGDFSEANKKIKRLSKYRDNQRRSVRRKEKRVENLRDRLRNEQLSSKQRSKINEKIIRLEEELKFHRFEHKRIKGVVKDLRLETKTQMALNSPEAKAKVQADLDHFREKKALIEQANEDLIEQASKLEQKANLSQDDLLKRMDDAESEYGLGMEYAIADSKSDGFKNAAKNLGDYKKELFDVLGEDLSLLDFQVGNSQKLTLELNGLMSEFQAYKKAILLEAVDQKYGVKKSSLLEREAAEGIQNKGKSKADNEYTQSSITLKKEILQETKSKKKQFLKDKSGLQKDLKDLILELKKELKEKVKGKQDAFDGRKKEIKIEADKDLKRINDKYEDLIKNASNQKELDALEEQLEIQLHVIENKYRIKAKRQGKEIEKVTSEKTKSFNALVDKNFPARISKLEDPTHGIAQRMLNAYLPTTTRSGMTMLTLKSFKLLFSDYFKLGKINGELPRSVSYKEAYFATIEFMEVEKIRLERKLDLNKEDYANSLARYITIDSKWQEIEDEIIQLEIDKEQSDTPEAIAALDAEIAELKAKQAPIVNFLHKLSQEEIVALKENGPFLEQQIRTLEDLIAVGRSWKPYERNHQ